MKYVSIKKDMARRVFTCNTCGRTIEKGEDIMVEVRVDDDREDIIKTTCEGCAIKTDVGRQLFPRLPHGQKRLSEY